MCTREEYKRFIYVYLAGVIKINLCVPERNIKDLAMCTKHMCSIQEKYTCQQGNLFLTHNRYSFTQYEQFINTDESISLVKHNVSVHTVHSFIKK